MYLFISTRWLGFCLDSFGSVILFFASIFAVMEKDSITAGVAGLSVSFAMQVCTGSDKGLGRVKGRRTCRCIKKFQILIIPTRNEILCRLPIVLTCADETRKGFILGNSNSYHHKCKFNCLQQM